MGMDLDDDDVFGNMFGRGAGGQRRGRPSTPQPSKQSVQHKVPLTLEELYKGTTKRLKVTRKLLDGATGKPVTTDKVLSIDVKPGWKAGTKIKFAEEGDELPGGGAQDIEFVVEEKPHPTFKREGDHLRTTITITLAEALTGFKKTITTLDGRSLAVSNNSVITPGQEHRFPGEGMPIKTTGKKGDLIVTYNIVFPQRLDEKQK